MKNFMLCIALLTLAVSFLTILGFIFAAIISLMGVAGWVIVAFIVSLIIVIILSNLE